MLAHSLGVRGLEGHSALLCGLGEGNTQLEKFEEHCREVLEPGLLVPGILLDVCLEGLIAH